MSVFEFVTVFQAAFVAILALSTALTYATPIGHNISSMDVWPIPLRPIVYSTLDPAAYRQLVDDAVSRIQHVYPGAYLFAVTCWADRLLPFASLNATKLLYVGFTLPPSTTIVLSGDYPLGNIGNFTWRPPVTHSQSVEHLPVPWPPKLDPFDAWRDVRNSTSVRNWTSGQPPLTKYVDYRVQSFTDIGNLDVYEFHVYDYYTSWHQYYIRADNGRLVENPATGDLPFPSEMNATGEPVLPLGALGVLPFSSDMNATGRYSLPLGNVPTDGVDDA